MLKMQVQDAPGTQMDAMYFGDVEAFLEFFREKYGKPAVDGLLRGQRSKVEAAFTYYPGINEYMGQKLFRSSFRTISESGHDKRMSK